jgi:tetratricopeptide (TPR) repeat protein
MDTVTYSNDQVINFVGDHFVPLKVNTKENKELLCSYGVDWSPIIVILDQEGREHYRIAGYLPPQDYLAHLALGRGKAELDMQNYEEAANRLSEVVCYYQDSDAAPEAYYWMGVAKYKKDGSPEGLMKDWKYLAEKYPHNIWAKKVSFLSE